MRVTRTLKPVAVTRAPDGSHVVDMGQNMVGRVRVTLPALQPGAVVTLRHAEMLTPEGALYRANLRTAAAEDRYVSDGAGRGLHAPLHRARLPLHRRRGPRRRARPRRHRRRSDRKRPRRDVGVGVVEPDTRPSARERPLESARQFPVHPTDCPQRDERLGWMADVGVFLPTAAYAMDLQGFMAKWMDDVLDARSSEGAFPDVAPRGPHGPDGGPAWGDAGVIVPMTLYRRYGDRRLLERCFPAMRAWTDLVSRHNPDRIARRNAAGISGTGCRRARPPRSRSSPPPITP